jgi:hypothetical protein
MDNADVGKKVFFLYPPTIIKEIIREIVRQEYEAYILESHTAALHILAKYKNSILFVNIDEILKEEEWEKYAASLLADPATSGTRVGILTYFKKEREVMEKYLITIGVQCGFIRIKMSPEECTQIILKTLAANEARGRRRYVRAICNEKLDLFNIIWQGQRFQGSIIDLSFTGMACYFQDELLRLREGTALGNIQLVLRGASCIVNGKVMKMIPQTAGHSIYIIMFDTAGFKPIIEEKIHTFIFHCLQETIKNETDALPKN